MGVCLLISFNAMQNNKVLISADMGEHELEEYEIERYPPIYGVPNGGNSEDLDEDDPKEEEVAHADEVHCCFIETKIVHVFLASLIKARTITCPWTYLSLFQRIKEERPGRFLGYKMPLES